MHSDKVQHKYLRLFAVLVNVLAFVGSIGIIGVSLYYWIEIGYSSAILGDYSASIAALITMISATVVFGMTPVGLYSMITSKRTMMLVYGVVILLISIVYVYAAYLSYSLKVKVNNGLALEWMTTSLEEEFGHPDGLHIDEAWHIMQRELKCCGIGGKNGKEWSNSTWQRSLSSFPRPRVPLSCCATCEEIHDKYCQFMDSQLDNVASKIDHLVNDEDSTFDLTPEQMICIKAIDVCSAAEDVVANEEICQGYSLPPPGIPMDVFAHTDGCYEPLRTGLTNHLTELVVFFSIFSVCLFICCSVWFVLYCFEFYKRDEYRSV